MAWRIQFKSGIGDAPPLHSISYAIEVFCLQNNEVSTCHFPANTTSKPVPETSVSKVEDFLGLGLTSTVLNFFKMYTDTAQSSCTYGTSLFINVYNGAGTCE